MINLTTTFTIPRSPYLIRPNSRILCIGSCFAENMGQRLADLPLDVSNQALGTLFHPLNILRGLSPQNLQYSDLYKQGHLYVHPDFHSQFMGENPEEFIASLTEIKAKTLAFLASSQYLIITWERPFIMKIRCWVGRLPTVINRLLRDSSKSRVPWMKSVWLTKISYLKIRISKLLLACRPYDIHAMGCQKMLSPKQRFD